MKGIFIISTIFFSGFAAAQQSPFNHMNVSDSSNAQYSFLVSGHFHGSSSNISGFPAASLLSSLDQVNACHAAFMVSTGDLFLDIKRDIPQYEVALFDKLKLPLFNVVGNHDIRDNVYQQHFGSTWIAFDKGSAKFILLDTEADDGNIEKEQWTFFSEQVNAAKNNAQTTNVFIFSHRPVWAEENEKLKNVFQGNTRSSSGNNFKTKVLPLLKLLKHKNIYWFSGSLGANAPASFFYYVDHENQITFIQSAIRDLPRDGALKINVDHDRVSFETLSFTTQKMPRLEDCGLEMWKTHPSENPFFWNLVPLYIKQMVFHRYFWYGAGYAVLGFVVLYFIRKRIKRKKVA